MVTIIGNSINNVPFNEDGNITATNTYTNAKGDVIQNPNVSGILISVDDLLEAYETWVANGTDSINEHNFIDVRGYMSAISIILSDVVGTIYYDYSLDGINISETIVGVYGIENLNKSRVAGFNLRTYPYVRLRYINGATAQTKFLLSFALSTTQDYSASSMSTPVTESNIGIITKSVIHGKTATGQYENVMTLDNAMVVHVDNQPDNANLATDAKLQQLIDKFNLLLPYVDGIEALLANIHTDEGMGNTNLASVITQLQQMNSYIDNLESYTDGLEGYASTANTLITALAGHVNTIEATLNTLTGKNFATEGTLDAAKTLLSGIQTKLNSGIVVTNLPLDYSTSGKQDIGNQLLTDIKGKDFATQTTLAAVLAKLIVAPATEAKQDVSNTALNAILTKMLTAPSTEAKQDALITLISARFPTTLGQKTMANSLAVTLASDQSSIPVTLTASNPTGTQANAFNAQVTTIATPVTSPIFDLGGKSMFTIFGNVALIGINLTIQYSADGVNFYNKTPVVSLPVGNFGYDFTTAARYVRLSCLGVVTTITATLNIK